MLKPNSMDVDWLDFYLYEEGTSATCDGKPSILAKTSTVDGVEYKFPSGFVPAAEVSIGQGERADGGEALSGTAGLEDGFPSREQAMMAPSAQVRVTAQEEAVLSVRIIQTSRHEKPRSVQTRSGPESLEQLAPAQSLPPSNPDVHSAAQQGQSGVADVAEASSRERRFLCPQCQRAFAAKKDLERHDETIHQQAVFPEGQSPEASTTCPRSQGG